MFEPESSNFEAPRFVPSTMSSVTCLNIDIKKSFQELSSILTAFSPQYASFLYMPIPMDPQGEQTFELKRDFIDHIGSQVVFSSGVEKDKSFPKGPENLIALRILNAQALEKSLSSLHNYFIASRKPDMRYEILGHTIYRLGYSFIPTPIGGQGLLQNPVDPQRPVLPVMAFAITETHLIFGEEDVVERSIRTLSGSEDLSVGATQWFKTAKSALPAATGFAGMEDMSSTGENLWSMIKELEEPQDIESNIEFGMGIDSATGPFPEVKLSQRLFDTSLLPEFDAIRKYFGLYISHLVSKPEGFLFEFKMLKSVGDD
jgi:hypothetical protein